LTAVHISHFVQYDEKLAIARRFLLPKQLEANVLSPRHVIVDDATLVRLITSYTMEAGVRTLEREIGAVCRFKAVEYAEARDADDSFDPEGDALPKGYNPEVKADDLETILGIAKYEPEVSDESSRPGVAIGMAYQGSGNGGLLHVEAASWPGKGEVRMTGSLGEVISESAELAVSWVRGNACVHEPFSG
jgi:ATP-dependent Lon protease